MTGNFSGKLLAKTEGTVDNPIGNISVGGTVTASGIIKVCFLDNFNVAGDMDGKLYGYGNATPTWTFTNVNITGNVPDGAVIHAPCWSKVVAHDVGGCLTETFPTQDFGLVSIGGDLLSTGIIKAGNGGNLTIGGNLYGTVYISNELGASTSGVTSAPRPPQPGWLRTALATKASPAAITATSSQASRVRTRQEYN